MTKFTAVMFTPVVVILLIKLYEYYELRSVAREAYQICPNRQANQNVEFESEATIEVGEYSDGTVVPDIVRTREEIKGQALQRIFLLLFMMCAPA